MRNTKDGIYATLPDALEHQHRMFLFATLRLVHWARVTERRFHKEPNCGACRWLAGTAEEPREMRETDELP